MRNLKALTSTSSQYFNRQLKRGGLYKVHSIFDNSFNLVNSESIFLNINHDYYTLTSIGLKIDEENFRTLRSQIKVGDIVKLKDNSITFYFESEVLNLSLPNVTVFKPMVTKVNPLVFDIIASLDDLMPDTFIKNKSLSNQQRVGLGNGFTPSGDDYNWGQMMIYQLADLDYESLDISKTTDISKAIYKRLLHQEWGWIYVKLFESDDPLKYINALKSYGHSSGHDTLYGMQQAINTLIKSDR